MIAVFATLIINGKKTMDDVPKLLQESVREMLNDLGVGDLV